MTKNNDKNSTNAEKILGGYPENNSNSWIFKKDTESKSNENIPTRVDVLNEAATLIVGDRQSDYGTPEENFARIAGYWNIYLSKKYKGLDVDPITPREVSDMMMLLKIARLANSPKRDSYVDIGGYSGISAELGELEGK